MSAASFHSPKLIFYSGNATKLLQRDDKRKEVPLTVNLYRVYVCVDQVSQLLEEVILG